MIRTLNLVFAYAREFAKNPRESLLLLRMAAWVGWLSLAVKFMPLPKALGTLSTDLATNPNHSPQSPAKLAGHIDRVLRTDWICFKPICWKRAAVLHRYLALNGIETRVVFGMRKEENGRVHGHAWLESNNNPILESEPPNYTVTYSFPSTTKFDLKLELLNE